MFGTTTRCTRGPSSFQCGSHDDAQNSANMSQMPKRHVGACLSALNTNDQARGESSQHLEWPTVDGATDSQYVVR